MKSSKKLLAIKYATVLVMLFFFLFPVFWIVLTSFQPISVLRAPIHEFSFSRLLDISLGNISQNYGGVIFAGHFYRYVANSLIVSLGTVAIVLPITLLAAYSLNRMSPPGKRYLRWLIYLSITIPTLPALFVLYKWWTALGLMDTVWGLILLYVQVPIMIFIMENFIATVPRELGDAARIDGCGTLGVIRRVILPLVAPGLVVVAIYVFMSCWNDVMVPMIFAPGNAKTVQVGLADFSSRFGSDYGGMAAATTLSMIPTAIFVVFAAKYLIAGLIGGAVKE